MKTPASPLSLAKALRNGETLRNCDSLLSFEEGKFLESHMTYDGYAHDFAETRPSWRQVLQMIKSKGYRA